MEQKVRPHPVESHLLREVLKISCVEEFDIVDGNHQGAVLK
jgi:hypothetical protein